MNNSLKRYYFFLSSFKGEAFTRCPQCQEKTKVRKFPFFVYVEPHNSVFLNMKSKFCPDCDLIILQQDALEMQLEFFFRDIDPEIIGNDYLVMGTVDKADWLKGKKGILSQAEMIKNIFPFNNYLQFDMRSAGWHFAKK